MASQSESSPVNQRMIHRLGEAAYARGVTGNLSPVRGAYVQGVEDACAWVTTGKVNSRALADILGPVEMRRRVLPDRDAAVQMEAAFEEMCESTARLVQQFLSGLQQLRDGVIARAEKRPE